MIYDVLIIGGGITGSMTARLLTQYKCSVALVEAGADIAWGATRANSAISHAGYDPKPGTLKAKLNVRGTELMEQACSDLGVEYKRCGSHVIAFDDADLAHIKELYERGISNGVPGLRLISGDELRKMEPNVSDAAVGSLCAPSAGIICPYGLAIAAAENAVTNGATVKLNFKVTEVSYNGNAYLVSNGKETVKAKYIVNAAGASADKVAAVIGEKDFPVVSNPRRGDYIILDKMYGHVANSTLFVTPSARGKGILVSPTVHGNTIFGPNAHDVSGPEDKATTKEGLDEIIAGAKRIMPTINPRGAITSFAGVRPTTNMPDFYIRASEQLPNVIHAASIESPGLASSPAIAEYITELLENSGLKLEKNPDYIKSRRKNGNPKRFTDMTDEEKASAVINNPAYGKVICRCETVTEGDILDAINAPIPATTVDMIKHRVRAGMGRCQGGFCSPRVADLLAEAAKTGLDEVTKSGNGSWIVTKRPD